MDSINGFMLADPLQYPYDPATESIPSQFNDVYGRMPHRLLASLAQYGRMVQDGKAVLEFEKLESHLATLTRFAEDSSLPTDFDTLLDLFPPLPSSSRHVFKSHTLNQKDSDVVASLQKQFPKLQDVDQITFPHRVMIDNWALLIVFPQQSVIEVYFISSFFRINFSAFTLKLSRILNMAGFTQQFQCKYRHQTPESFAVNRVVMALILVREVHTRGKYLDFTLEMIMGQKLCLMDDFVRHHDRWLGKLNPRLGEHKSHPFLTTEFKDKDHFPELEEMGWSVIDVEGDGNCGFYCLMLGLENIGNIRYRPSIRGNTNTSTDSSMSRNVPWQYNVLVLRKDLQDESIRLLDTVYTPDIRPSLPWYFLTTAIEESEFEELSCSFHTDQLTQQQYFDRTLTKTPDDEDNPTRFNGTIYQMNPFWSGLVFSSKFNSRVIMYVRQASYNKTAKQVTYAWSTTTMNKRLPVENHIVQQLGLHPISDTELNRMHTIEILYTTGFINEATPDSQHFQFLRRIYCSNTPNPAAPVPGTLRDHIERLAATSTTNTQVDNPDRSDQNKPNARMPKGKTMNIVLKGKATKRTTVSRKKKNAKNIQKTTSKHIREKKWLLEQLTETFNKQFVEQTSKHKNSTRMKYDPSKKQYLTRLRGDDGKLQRQQICRNISIYDKTLIDAANSHPGVWVGPSVGDSSNNGSAPRHLCTNVKLLYEQHGKPFCLTYSLASALFHCGLKFAAYELARQAPDFAQMHTDLAISSLKDLMANLVPVIGRPTMYGIRTGRNKKKRTITFDDLFNNLTPYPTIVVPYTADVNGTHAFCVVDDLIFDSITPYALKLQRESVDWIFNGAGANIEYALRFNMKVSPRGVAINETYQHTLTFHWDHPSRPTNTVVDIGNENQKNKE